MDGVNLKIFWNQLVGVTNELARALKQTAFSPVVRETGDLAVAICDPAGRMLALAQSGAPGHINTMGLSCRAFLRDYPAATLVPGDVLITNDPWEASGHLFDVVVMAPIFNRRERLIGFVGSSIHHTDIGGYGIGAGARDIHEEGLWIPSLKLFEGGRPNETLFRMIQRNVRLPNEVKGDLMAQVSCARSGGERTVALCARHGLDDLDEVGNQIIARSEESTRAAIRKLKAGRYLSETAFDVLGRDDEKDQIHLKVALEIDAELGEIHADFDGSSPASKMGINVCFEYAFAYCRYAVRTCLNPDVPNNEGSLAPIRFSAPAGSILNAQYPAPVSARHIVGMYLPIAITNALYEVLPDAVLAESVGMRWGVQVSGRLPNGRPFTGSQLSMSGGMGARSTKPGLTATSYPTGNATVPVEILEASCPIQFERKEIRDGSGGQGRQRGGDGQIIQFRVRGDQPWMLNGVINRTRSAAKGIGGGGPGLAGRFLINGESRRLTSKIEMQPGDVLRMETPGGGGFGLAESKGRKSDGG